MQNENGPCPLLAASNALLLRGTINLPSACIRSGAASLEEVINMLAEKAMTYKQEDTTTSTTTAASTKDNNTASAGTGGDGSGSGAEDSKGDDNNNNVQEERDESSMQKALHDILEILPKLQVISLTCVLCTVCRILMLEHFGALNLLTFSLFIFYSLAWT